MDSRAVFFFALRFWPGFQKLWLKGDFHSLLVSLLFGWVFVVAWLATFVWPEWLNGFFSPDWLARGLLGTIWLSLLFASFRSAILTVFSNSRSTGSGGGERQKNLENAQELYLQANYFEAERFVRENLSGDLEDVESSLLWIAILRRTRRISQALDLISNIDKLDAAIPWLAELRSEKEQCLRIKIQTPPAHD